MTRPTTARSPLLLAFAATIMVLAAARLLQPAHDSTQPIATAACWLFASGLFLTTMVCICRDRALPAAAAFPTALIVMAMPGLIGWLPPQGWYSAPTLDAWILQHTPSTVPPSILAIAAAGTAMTLTAHTRQRSSDATIR